jgi:hypothetical protein
VKTTARLAKIDVSADGKGLVSQAGVVALAEVARVSGLDRELRAALAPFCRPFAVHLPGTVVLHLAMTLALGGDCLADIAVARGHAGLLGPVASDPTVSRVITDLAGDADGALAGLRAAHAAARARVHALGGAPAARPQIAGLADVLVPLDLDATLVTAHSDKEGAAPTFKRGYGHHPIWAALDHGAGAGGEALDCLLRPGNAGSNTAADLLAALDLALAQVPAPLRANVLVRSDAAGSSHGFLAGIASRGLAFSVGFTITEDVAAAVAALPEAAWTPAYDAGGAQRDGADVAELTGLLGLPGWPAGMRVIARREIPHPGAQLRLTDIKGRRITCFATTVAGGQLAALELRHRQRARCEDRIRCAKDTGLENLPLHSMNQNAIWCQIVTLAADLLTWLQLLALDGEHRAAEPRRLRLHLLAVAGRITRSGRRMTLRLDASWHWAGQLAAAITRLQQLPNPG